MADISCSQEQLVIEQDTPEIEDIHDITEVLFPSMLSECDQFGLVFNRKLFAGWVKQPSPCCGASAVAGAINALKNLHRSHSNALNHLDVMNLYIFIFNEMIHKKKSSFQRRLGCSSIDSVIVLLREEIEILSEPEATKKKSPYYSKRKVLLALNNIIQEHRKSKSNINDFKEDCIQLNSTIELSALELLGELIDGTETNKDDIDQEKSDSEDSEMDIDPPSSKPLFRQGVPKVWNWQGDLISILKTLSGIEKMKSPRPSTAAVGNLVLMQCVSKLLEFSSLGTGIESRLFMGKKLTSKQKVDFPLSRKDSADSVQSQWDGLRSALSRPDTALIFHLTNHFAVIFALREWVKSPKPIDATTDNTTTSCAAANSSASASINYGGVNDDPIPVLVRQIFTARRGQRPSAWIDFEEVREIMLGWGGYKIIAVKRNLTERELQAGVLNIPSE